MQVVDNGARPGVLAQCGTAARGLRHQLTGIGIGAAIWLGGGASTEAQSVTCPATAAVGGGTSVYQQVRIGQGDCLASAGGGGETVLIDLNAPRSGSDYGLTIRIWPSAVAAPALTCTGVSVAAGPTTVSGFFTARYTVPQTDTAHSCRFTATIDGDAVTIPIRPEVRTLSSDGRKSVQLLATSFSLGGPPPDSTPPTLFAATRVSPTGETATGGSVTWRLRFDEPVAGVDPADFQVNGGSLPVTVSASTGEVFDITAQVAGVEGPITLNFAPGQDIADQAGNGFAAASAPPIPGFTRDGQGPQLTDVIRRAPAASPSRASELIWEVRFSEPVTGVEAGDFRLTGSDAALSQVSATEAQVVLRATGGDLAMIAGTVTLSLSGGHGIADLSGNALTGTAPTGLNQASVGIDNAAPRLVAVNRVAPASYPTNAGTLRWALQFSEPIIPLAASNLSLTGSTAAVSVAMSSDNRAEVTATGGDLASRNGVVTLALTGTDVTDLVGNPLTADRPGGAAWSVRLDTRGPAITLDSDAPSPVLADSFVVRVHADEPVADWATALAALPVSGGTLESVQPLSDRAAAVTLRSNGAGQVTLTVPAGHFRDAVGNPSTGPVSLSRDIDATPPHVLRISRAEPAGPVVRAARLTWQVQFSEAVTGVTASDFALTGSSAALSVAASGPDRVGVTAEGGDLGAVSGQIGLALAPGAAITDLAGLPLAAPNPSAGPAETYQMDVAGPALTLSSPAPFETNLDRLPVVLEASEALEGLALDDLQISGATAEGLTGAGARYSFDLLPLGDGPISVTLLAGAAQDAVGNDSAAPVPLRFESDRTLPEVALDPPMATPVATGPFTAFLTFSEPISGFEIGDLQITGGTLTGLRAEGGARVFAVMITPEGDTPVTLTLAPDSLRDAAGNAPVPVTLGPIAVDQTPPEVTVSSATPDPFLSGALTITLDLSEPVQDWPARLNALSVVNGAITSLDIASATTALITVTPGGEGPVGLDVPAGHFTDLAGSAQITAASLRRSFTPDLTGPIVTLRATGPSPSNAATIPVEVLLSEPVAELTLADFTTANGSVADLTGGPTQFQLTLTPTDDGPVTLSLVEGVIADAQGNPNAAASLTVLSDQTAPRISGIARLDPVVEVTAADQVTWRISFDEPVSGIEIGQFAVTGTSATATLSQIGPMRADVTLTGGDLADLTGVVSLSVRPEGIVDLAGTALGNVAPLGPNEVQYSLDNTTPTAMLSDLPMPMTGAVRLDLTFSEPVSGLGLGALTASNARVSDLTGSGAAYQVTVTPEGEGPVTVNLTAGAATDAAGWPTPDAAVQGQADLSGPAATLSGLPDVLIGPGSLQVTFTEPVADLTLDAFAATNATLSELTGADAAYTLTVTPLAEGPVTLTLPAGAVTDAAGQPNTGAEIRRLADLAAPTVTLGGLPDVLTGPATLEIAFSEPVTGLASDALTAENATLSGFDGAGADYTLLVTPDADGPVTIRLAAEAARDAGGRPAPAAELLRQADLSMPQASFSAAEGVATGPIPVELLFSEPVTGVAEDVLHLDNATLDGLSGSGARYQMTVTPMTDGAFALTLAENAVQNGAGQGNAGPVRLSRTADLTPPTVEIAALPDEISGPVPVTIRFSEPVTGFALSDLTVENAALSDLDGTGTAFTAVLTPQGDGPVRLALDAGQVQDAAGHPNAAAPPVTSTALIPATAAIGGIVLRAPGDPLPGPVEVTVEFGTAVTDLTLEDFSTENAQVSDLEGGPETFRLRLTPAADGPLWLELRAEAVRDAEGGTNADPVRLTRQADLTPPQMSLTGMSDLVTGPVALELIATEPLQGFDPAQIGVENATITLTDTAEDRFLLTLTPLADGPLRIWLPDGAATDAAGHPTPALEVTATADLTGPTVTLAGVPDPLGGAYPVTVRFSEPVEGLALSDFVLTAATVSELRGSGADYTLTVTPEAPDHTVFLPGDVVVDAAGWGNLPSDLMAVRPDGTPPELTITGLPDSVSTGVPVTVQFQFSEPVTGFAVDDITVENGTVSGFGGADAQYQAQVTADGAGPLTVTVAAGAAVDASGEGSEGASATAALAVEAAPQSAAISEFLQARARHLLANQPEIRGFLTGQASGRLDVGVTQGIGRFDFQTAGRGPVWLSLHAAQSRDDTGQDSQYRLGVIGSHREIGDHAILGAMLQFDQTEMTASTGAEVSGDGWLFGPYIAAQWPGQPLYFEGRVLFGQTENEITLPGGPVEAFSGDRRLAMVAVSGAFHGDRLSTFPSLTYSHVAETQEGFQTAGGTLVPEQRISISELALGLDFEMPFALDQGDLAVTWGVSGIWSDSRGAGAAQGLVPAQSAARGRVDLGYVYDNGRGFSSSASAFWDGLGSDEGSQSYGLEARLQLAF